MNQPAVATAATFFALLADLERREGAARVGEASDHGRTIWLQHSPSFAFPAGEVAAVHLDGPLGPEVTGTFFGLTGCLSPLPEHLLEGWSQQDGQGPLHALFAVWHHRLLALLYRSISRFSPSGEHARDGSDLWSQRLRAWGPASRCLPLWRELAWLPQLAKRGKTAAGLNCLLTDLCRGHVAEHDIAIEQCSGGWQPLCPSQHLCLGRSQHMLGTSTVLGHHIRAPGSAFTVHLRDVGAPAYAWLTAGGGLQQVEAVVLLFAPEGVAGHIALHLSGSAHLQWLGQTARLGSTTWLGKPRQNFVLHLPMGVDATAAAA